MDDIDAQGEVPRHKMRFSTSGWAVRRKSLGLLVSLIMVGGIFMATAPAAQAAGCGFHSYRVQQTMGTRPHMSWLTWTFKLTNCWPGTVRWRVNWNNDTDGPCYTLRYGQTINVTRKVHLLSAPTGVYRC